MLTMEIASTWGQLIKQRRDRTIYRIVLSVRGRTVIKEFKQESQFRRWKGIYTEQLTTGRIDSMQTQTFYTGKETQ